MDIRKTQLLGFGLDLLVGSLFALTSAFAFRFVLFIHFGVGVLIGFLLYDILRTLSWAGSRTDSDV